MAATVWFNAVKWSFPTLAPSATFLTVFEANRQPLRTDQLKANTAERAPHLAFQTSIGAINDPLPLGIVVNHSAGGETLVLSDLAEGAKLSAGTPLSPTRWSIPGRDVDKAFIAAPENFSGSMQVTVKLYSSNNLLLETKNTRFEWTGSQAEKRPASFDLTNAARPVPGLAADGTDATRASDRPMPLSVASGKKAPAEPAGSPPSTSASFLERGERLLREGNVAAARPWLRRAASAGSAEAALDLGISFDPSFVPNAAAADPVRAARWYKRAFKLGRKDVAADLERVTNMAKTAPP